MNVQILNSVKGKGVVPIDPLGCGKTVAELVPYMVKNDDFNRKLQKEALGKVSPDEYEDPILVYAPTRNIHLSTARKLGRVVNAETGEDI